jgi:hypothetical protein
MEEIFNYITRIMRIRFYMIYRMRIQTLLMFHTLQIQDGFLFQNNIPANPIDMNQVHAITRSKHAVLASAINNASSAFYNWFLLKFPEAPKWFLSRSNYTKTCAVSSMIGWVTGLGDRHIENILMDQLTGDVVHIDLNLVFEQGTTLEVRERVPFRLTWKDAMGVTGYEGMFRRNCELTLQILRSNKDALMHILEQRYFILSMNCQLGRWNQQLITLVMMNTVLLMFLLS